MAVYQLAYVDCEGSFGINVELVFKLSPARDWILDAGWKETDQGDGAQAGLVVALAHGWVETWRVDFERLSFDMDQVVSSDVSCLL